MKRAIILLIASLLTLVMLVISSCAPAAAPAPSPTPTPVPTSPTPTPAPTSAVEKPKYGGILTVPGAGSGYDDLWDPFAGSSTSPGAIYEPLLTGDWYLPEKEWPSYYIDYTAAQTVGCLAESWEMKDPQTFVFHIRKGVHWQNRPPVNGRELTAEDVKWSFDWTMTHPTGPKGILPIIDKITTTDKYTVVFHTSAPRTIEFLTEAFRGSVNVGGIIAPHEMVDVYGKNGFADWKHACGTGPWIATDYLTGSATTFVRNPDYWEYDKTYPQNRLPYADGMRFIIIRDISTQLSALRTGKLDTLAGVDFDQMENLTKTSPWLNYRELKPIGSVRVVMNVNKPPLTDVRVRQALNMGIDHQQIIKDIYRGHAQLPYSCWPFPSYWPEFIKPEEYPQIVRDMFSHNTVKAKQLLSEAGFPNGFKIEVMLESKDVDMTSIVKEQMTQIGVQLELKQVEAAVKRGPMVNVTYPGILVYGATGRGAGTYSLSSTFARYYTGTGGSNYTGYDDKGINEMLEKVQQTQDAAARTKMYKEMAIKVMVDAPYLLFTPNSDLTLWPKWIKGGYFGQYGMFWGDKTMEKHWWIDQDVKNTIMGNK